MPEEGKRIKGWVASREGAEKQRLQLIGRKKKDLEEVGGGKKGGRERVKPGKAGDEQL